MKLLFIGNSYTYYYDMPLILEVLANENGYGIKVDAVTKGGRKLIENLDQNDENNAKIRALCENNTYDVLFLQEQSYLALIDKGAFLDGLSGLIEMVNAKELVLYATWGRKEGCELLETLSLSTDEMTLALAKEYEGAAKKYDARISPVGMCFYGIKHSCPDVELYDPDLSHPSYVGSCVAAICHYRTLFGEMPKKFETLKLDAAVYKKIAGVIEAQ